MFNKGVRSHGAGDEIGTHDPHLGKQKTVCSATALLLTILNDIPQ